MPLPGQILWYKDFEFEDQSKKDKLFVVLNNTEANPTCLVLKTTSQAKRYEGVDKGCNPEKNVFYVPNDWEHCFKVNTFIQLPQIFPVSVDTLLVGEISRKIFVTGSLSVECWDLLKNCLRRFKDDIAEDHWKMIFRSK